MRRVVLVWLLVRLLPMPLAAGVLQDLMLALLHEVAEAKVDDVLASARSGGYASARQTDCAPRLCRRMQASCQVVVTAVVLSLADASIVLLVS